VNFRLLEFSPQATPRTVRMLSHSEYAAVSPGDKGFLRSWFEQDFDLGEAYMPHRINWGAISGLALALAISAGFWTGLGLLLERVWK
jgi:hypothetical protein